MLPNHEFLRPARVPRLGLWFLAQALRTVWTTVLVRGTRGARSPRVRVHRPSRAPSTGVSVKNNSSLLTPAWVPEFRGDAGSSPGPEMDGARVLAEPSWLAAAHRARRLLHLGLATHDSMCPDVLSFMVYGSRTHKPEILFSTPLGCLLLKLDSEFLTTSGPWQQLCGAGEEGQWRALPILALSTLMLSRRSCEHTVELVSFEFSWLKRQTISVCFCSIFQVLYRVPINKTLCFENVRAWKQIEFSQKQYLIL